MGGLTLDTGALIALEKNRKGMVEIVRAATADGVRIIVPANVLAEWWRGRSDRREYVLGMFEVKDVDAKIGKLAGEALAWLDGDVNDKVTIDATVMATAALYGPSLLTGDRDDMDRFKGFFPSVRLFGLRLP
jgi:predicted nucleic acid-binding protein